jgi:hypothetical protein
MTGRIATAALDRDVERGEHGLIRSGSVLRSAQGACSSIYCVAGEDRAHPAFERLGEGEPVEGLGHLRAILRRREQRAVRIHCPRIGGQVALQFL